MKFLSLIFWCLSMAQAGYQEKVEKVLANKITSSKKCSEVMGAMASPPKGKDRLILKITAKGTLSELQFETQNPANAPYWQCLQKYLKGTFLVKPARATTIVTFMDWELNNGGDNYIHKTVKESVETYNADFQKCYESYIHQGGNKAGELMLAWSISEAGKPFNIGLQKDDISNAALKSCIIGVVEKMTFPKPPANTSVSISFPIKFSTSKR